MNLYAFLKKDGQYIAVGADCVDVPVLLDQEILKFRSSDNMWEVTTLAEYAENYAKTREEADKTMGGAQAPAATE